MKVHILDVAKCFRCDIASGSGGVDGSGGGGDDGGGGVGNNKSP